MKIEKTRKLLPVGSIPGLGLPFLCLQTFEGVK